MIMTLSEALELEDERQSLIAEAVSFPDRWILHRYLLARYCRKEQTVEIKVVDNLVGK